jgi:hypothetical protein
MPIPTKEDGDTLSAAEINGLQAEVNALAPKASPALTGTPTAPTATVGTNSTQLATTAFVKAALDALLASAPGALDTLDELAAALGDDANFAATITAALALKAPLASPALTGTPTAPTVAGTSDSTTKIATTAFVQAVAAALSTTLSDDAPITVAAGDTLTLTRAAHQGRTIVLDGAGATVALNGTTQGAGFACSIENNTGAAWTIPTITGAANRFPRGEAHTLLHAGSAVHLELLTLGGTLRARWNGDTYAP